MATDSTPHRFWKSPKGHWYVIGPGPEANAGDDVLVEKRSGEQEFRRVAATVGYVYALTDEKR